MDNIRSPKEFQNQEELLEEGKIPELLNSRWGKQMESNVVGEIGKKIL